MKIKYIFSDFDGTLTENGNISTSLLEFIEQCNQKKIELVIVSGRSVSWGHFFLTHLPLKYCVMESGGAICFKDKNGMIKTKLLASKNELNLLVESLSELKLLFPKIQLAEDNVGRLTDRAIELKWLKSKNNYTQIKKYMHEKSFHYTTSSVHLNYSSTANNKWNGVCYLIKKILKMDINKTLKFSIYFGDAPNDEIMFQHFPLSVGVGNIKPYLKDLTYKPKYVQKEKEILGVIDFLKSK